MKQKKLIFNFIVNRNCKKLTDSRKRAKILADNRKRHHPIETLFQSGGEKIRTTTSGNQGENERECKKSEQEDIPHFLHKTCN